MRLPTKKQRSRQNSGPETTGNFQSSVLPGATRRLTTVGISYISPDCQGPSCTPHALSSSRTAVHCYTDSCSSPFSEPQSAPQHRIISANLLNLRAHESATRPARLKTAKDANNKSRKAARCEIFHHGGHVGARCRSAPRIYERIALE